MNDMPEYAKTALYDGGSGINGAGILSGIGGILGGLFGDSGAPYDAAADEYQKWAQKGEDVQNPFYNAGLKGMGNYQDWLQEMKDPTKFINSLQSQYQASPYSRYLQNQSMLSGQNAASASGLIGSTPFAQQLQQNSNNIASGDMSDWLQRVLGINDRYGQGQQNLMTGGQNAANSLTGLYSNMGNNMANAAYGREAGGQQDMWNTIGGIADVAAGIFGL